MKAKLYSHKKMELFLDAVSARYEEKEGWRQRRRVEGEKPGKEGKVVRDGFGLHCARRKNRKRR